MHLAHCIGCGCHDFAACTDEATGCPCSWLVVDRKAGKGVCSACQEHLVRWHAGDRSLAVPVDDQATSAVRAYEFNGITGCVVQRKSRRTGRLIGLYNADQAGMDPEAGPWVTVCEEHATCVNHPTLALARSHLADPAGWCELCPDEPENRP